MVTVKAAQPTEWKAPPTPQRHTEAETQKSRRHWEPPSVHKPLDPPKGNIDALPWVPEPEKPLVFHNAKIVDVAKNTIHDGMTAIIENGYFKDIFPTSDLQSQKKSLPKDSKVVDLDGLYLCPGLIDCHVHINFSDGRPAVRYVDPHLRATYTLRKMLERGFTTVRDVGGATFFQKEAIDQWLTPGPRLFQGGPILSQTGGHGDSRTREEQSTSLCCSTPSEMSKIVDGVPEATRAARDLMRQGAQHIKIATSGGVSSPTDALDSVQFSPEEIRAIVQVCKDMKGTMVTAHAYTSEAIRRAVENGVRGIEHGNLLDRETARLLASTGTFLTPTLMISTAKGRAPWNASLPEYMREKNAMVRDAGRRAIQIAEEEGVCVCFGTDLTIGMGYLQSEEFTQRHSLLPSHKVLAHATINAAKQLNDPKLGRIETGAYGDCLILLADPLKDCRVLDSGEKGIWGVVKEGRVVVAREDFAERLALEKVPIWRDSGIS